MEDSQLKAKDPERRVQGDRVGEREEEGALPPVRDATVISGQTGAQVSSVIAK